MTIQVKGNQWAKLCQAHGGKEGARKHVAKWLRYMADHLDSDKVWPDIYQANIPVEEPTPHLTKDFIEEFTVTLSHPWPG